MASFQHVKKVLPGAAIACSATTTTTFLGSKSSTYTTQKFTTAATTNLQKSMIQTATKTGASSSSSHSFRMSPQMLLKEQLQRSSSTTATTTNNTMRSMASSARPVEKTTQTLNATSKNDGGGGGGFLAWYESHLNARPVLTKAITGSFLWGVGDAVAQIVPQVFFDDDANEDNGGGGGAAAAAATTDKKKDFAYDYPRTARAVTFGFVIHAPLSHLHFNFLEWMTVKGGFTGLSIPVFKAFMEQFVYWSWFSNSLYHGAMGAMQGMSFQQIYDRIEDVLWDTQKAQWVFWIPVQLLNFRFVPVRHQLNVVLLTSVVWTALLSAWYPPGEEDDDDDTKKIEAVVEENKKE